MNFLNIDVKKAIRSRTIWFNILTLIGGIATAIAYDISAGGTISVVAILNIVLRVLTTQAIVKVK